MRSGTMRKVLTVALLSVMALVILSVADAAQDQNAEQAAGKVQTAEQGKSVAKTDDKVKNDPQVISKADQESKKAATLRPVDIVLIETNELLKASGKLTLQDEDRPVAFVPYKKNGSHGIFNIDASGAWFFVTKGTLNYLQAGEGVSDSFIVTSKDGLTTTVKITVDGTNDPAILGSADVVLKETNEPLRTGGKLTIKDVDSPAVFIAQDKVAGKYGTFNIDESGAWAYTANSAFDYLNVGQSVSDSFTVSSADGTTTTVKVTINGTNDPAILSPAYVVLKYSETNVLLRTEGRLTIKDVDSPETFAMQQSTGDYGTFNIDTSGAWTYVTDSAIDDLDANQSISDSFTVYSSDGTSTTVRIVINDGSNIPAILSSADVTLSETNVPLRTNGKLTIDDEDSPETFVAQSHVAGAYGIFSINSSGAWTYIANSAFDYLNVGQSVSDSFIVSSADGTTTTVKITINGTNDPAILGSANVVLQQGNDFLATRGKLSIRDVDSPEIFIAEKKYGNYGTLNVFASGVWSYATQSALEYLKAGQGVSDNFVLNSADGTPTTVNITINGINDPAILSADDVVLIETNEPLKTSGQLTILDVDSPGTFVAQKKIGSYGTFNIDTTGAWSYVAKSAFDYLQAGDGISDVFTVSSADETTTTVTITIDGTNDPAVLSSADVVLTETDAPLQTSGKLTIKDVDSPATFVEQSKKDGSYGTFKIDASGSWTYMTNGALNDLKAGESVFDIFTVASADGTTTTVKITINGSNDPAILSSADVVLEETNEPLKTSGTLTVKDADSPETFIEQRNVAGINGVFSIDASGAWNYVANSAFDYLNVGKSVSDKFTVSSADGTTTTVKITINGTNDPAILSAAEEVLIETNEPLSTHGQLSNKDVDSPETFVAQRDVAGSYGVFNINASGAWTYATNNALDFLSVGQGVSDSFTVSSSDGTITTVKVTINGTNDPAILGAADVTLTETNLPLKTGGTLSIRDVDSPETFVAQKMTAGAYGIFDIDSKGNWTYATNSALDFLSEGQSVSDSFTVFSADGTTTAVKVTVNGSNDPAILSAADVVLKAGNVPLKTGGKLRIRDADSPQTFVAQSNIAGSNGIFNINTSGEWTYVANSAFDHLKTGRSVGDIFSVSSADGTSTTVRVTINGTYNPELRK
ncbi:MAG: hypothetical protein HY016_06150 [Nitrosomonadales bacterium]|nr:hypothetical protein [Nitrosomonadales bacterium]